MSDRTCGAVAGAWGLAEATFFFFVPDVFVSFVALRDLKRALIGCLWALAGSLAGGFLMFAWGGSRPAAAERGLDLVPAIHPETIERVEEEIADRGTVAVLLGPLSGTPYKIYAVEAGKRGDSLAAFLAITVPARLIRFVVVSLLVAALGGRLRGWTLKRKRCLLLTSWIAFYLFYFWRIGL